ncbi:MAG: carboxypeptidase-like regulatory domain-containing protein [Ekhidna sp.]|nr:carboxypeptidase-like regulatory domain-containing protein [Ekhidna sp.]
MTKLKELFLLLAVVPSFTFAQDKFTINGYVKDASNGESLIGATVLIKEIGTGNVTNVYGFYSITVPAGNYTVEISYLGFQTQTREISLTGNIRIDIELGEEQTALQEVVVTAEAADKNVTSTEMSIAELDIKTAVKMPAFMGEVDVIKSLQSFPGVSTVGEGASGFNVRGGSVGQNLLLLDEAPVYQSSHLFGFFSVFNPDAVKDMKLYKGGIPAQYGGRISSVLDIRMKEGDSKKMNYEGGVGLIFGRFAVQGPIIKDRTSFIAAGRRSWADFLLKPANVLNNSDQVYFYDLTMKANHTFNDRNRLFLSGYWGRDIFQFEGAGFNWGNRTGTLRWNHLVNDRLFTNFSLIYSKYDYELAFGEEVDNSFNWDSEITTVEFKPQASYFINISNELKFGGRLTYYEFEPANAVGISEGEPIDLSVAKRYAAEGAVYINNNQKIFDRLRLTYGIRLSVFNFLGSGNAYVLEDPAPGRRKQIADTVSYGSGEVIESFITPEPRISFNYQLNNTSSIKGSYNRMAQYIHLVSVTTAPTPLDLWVPSTNNLSPEKSHLYSLGYFRNLSNNKYELSGEVWFRTISNQLDYRNGLSTGDLLINEVVERDLLSAKGRAYGLEFYAKKNSGRLNGWISYTLSRAEINTEGLNNNEWYPANHDQMHNLKIAGFYDLSKKVRLSANFAFISGRPFTVMNETYEIAGYTVYNGDRSRNNDRIANYHRLDLSMTIDLYKGNKPGRENSLVLSVYNVYGRQNAFSNFINQSDANFGEAAIPEYNQFSVIGFPFPSISYNFKF